MQLTKKNILNKVNSIFNTNSIELIKINGIYYWTGAFILELNIPETCTHYTKLSDLSFEGWVKDLKEKIKESTNNDLKEKIENSTKTFLQQIIENDFNSLIRNSKNIYANFHDIENQYIVECKSLEDNKIVILTNEGFIYVLLHIQDCCEYVSIEDICGDLMDLKGLVVRAEESQSDDFDDRSYDSHTWTFYKLDTINGGVTIRFYGNSNGYYSETVNCIKFDFRTKFTQFKFKSF